MGDSETTFSVEVKGFPPDADPEVVSASISGFFGISLEEGRRLVRKAPIRVKRGATPEVTQRLVRQLRKLGADVTVRNEQSGEERVYRAGDPRGSVDPERDPLSPPSSKNNTLPSEDGDAPLQEKAPRVDVLSAGDVPIAGEAGADEAASDGAEAGADGAAASPGAAEEGAADAAAGPVSAPASAPVSPRRSGPGMSLPPPSSPILGMPAQSAAKLDFCGSCSRPVDKGETCARCGWSNVTKERHCRQCKKKLSIVSAISRKPAIVGLFAIGCIAAFAAGFVLFGMAAGAGAAAFVATLAFVADGFTLRYACRSCTVAVYTERLQKEETGRLRTARGKSLVAGALCLVAAGGFFAGTGVSGRTLSASSYGFAWSVRVPSTHSSIGSEIGQVKVPTGTKRVRVQYAERPYIGGATYYLAHLQYTYPAGPVEPDRAGLEAALRQVVATVFVGNVTGDVTPSGESLQVSFTGTFHGKPVTGRLRATQYEHDMVFVGLSAANPGDAAALPADQLFGSLEVQRESK